MKQTINIRGIHCRSCEILIEGKLKEIPHVNKVIVSYKSKNAIIFSDKPISEELLRHKIEDAGYSVGADGPKEWLTKNPIVYKELVKSFILILVLYLIAKSLGLFNISISSSNPSNLWIVLLVGITAGLSTCMALVGGLILGISAKHAEKHPEATSAEKFRPHLYFNFGRILSYFVLGGIIGLVGKAFQLSGTTLGSLTIFVGLVMLLLGIQLTELSPKLSGFSFTLPTGLSKFFGIKKHHQKEYSHKNSIITGTLTFFLPCGFTQAMQLYAMTTGSFIGGALIMATFAIGTAPGLLGIGGFTSIIKGSFAKRFFKFAGIIVILLALFNISNGLNLTGITSKLANYSKNNNKVLANDPNVKIENGVQIIRMNQLSTGYSPKNFIIKKGIPAKWIINSKDPGSCAASLYSQKLNVRKYLNSGENIIEFTPTEIGKIPFSCSMGMYRGWFDVVENNDGTSSQSIDQITNPVQDDQDSQTNNNSQNSNDLPKENEQLLTATYSTRGDISPKEFSVKVGLPVRLEIDAQDDGRGCMGSITIPGLVEDFDYLEKGKKTIFSFIPQQSGEYYITCAMGVPRGRITIE